MSPALSHDDDTHFGYAESVTRADRQPSVTGAAHETRRQEPRASSSEAWTVKTASAPVISKTRATMGCMPAR